MKSASRPSDKIQHLSSEQVSAAVERSGLSRLEFAQKVGCGTSQLFKYQQEGLPPTMNKVVRANILRAAIETGVVADNAAARAEIAKLSGGRTAERDTKDKRRAA